MQRLTGGIKGHLALGEGRSQTKDLTFVLAIERVLEAFTPRCEAHGGRNSTHENACLHVHEIDTVVQPLSQMKCDFDVNSYRHGLAILCGGVEAPSADRGHRSFIQAHAKATNDLYIPHLARGINDDVQADNALEAPGASRIGKSGLRLIQDLRRTNVRGP